MHSSSRFTSQEIVPWGRQLGRQLDPIDARFGVPVEVVGGYAREVQGSYPFSRGLDEKSAELRAAKERAKADAKAKARDEARKRLADKVEGGTSPSIVTTVARFAPYALAAAAIVVVVILIRKKGA